MSHPAPSLTQLKTLLATKGGPSQAVRDRAASNGQALPEGGFPIRNREDLRKAIAAYGRAKNKAAAKRHIIKRARALGLLSMLPTSWSVKDLLFIEDMEEKTRHVRTQEGSHRYNLPIGAPITRAAVEAARGRSGGRGGSSGSGGGGSTRPSGRNRSGRGIASAGDRSGSNRPEPRTPGAIVLQRGESISLTTGRVTRSDGSTSTHTPTRNASEHVVRNTSGTTRVAPRVDGDSIPGSDVRVNPSTARRTVPVHNVPGKDGAPLKRGDTVNHKGKDRKIAQVRKGADGNPDMVIFEPLQGANSRRSVNEARATDVAKGGSGNSSTPTPATPSADTPEARQRSSRARGAAFNGGPSGDASTTTPPRQRSSRARGGAFGGGTPAAPAPDAPAASNEGGSNRSNSNGSRNGGGQRQQGGSGKRTALAALIDAIVQLIRHLRNRNGNASTSSTSTQGTSTTAGLNITPDTKDVTSLFAELAAEHGYPEWFVQDLAVTIAGRKAARVAKRPKFDPKRHPRDRHGKFIKTGATVDLPGGGTGKVTGIDHNGKVQVQHSGKTDTIDAGKLTVHAGTGTSPKDSGGTDLGIGHHVQAPRGGSVGRVTAIDAAASGGHVVRVSDGNGNGYVTSPDKLTAVSPPTPQVTNSAGHTFKPGDRVQTRSGALGTVRSVDPDTGSARVAVDGSKWSHVRHRADSLKPAPAQSGSTANPQANAPSAPATPAATPSPSAATPAASPSTPAVDPDSGPDRFKAVGATYINNVTSQKYRIQSVNSDGTVTALDLTTMSGFSFDPDKLPDGSVDHVAAPGRALFADGSGSAGPGEHVTYIAQNGTSGSGTLVRVTRGGSAIIDSDQGGRVAVTAGRLSRSPSSTPRQPRTTPATPAAPRTPPATPAPRRVAGTVTGTTDGNAPATPAPATPAPATPLVRGGTRTQPRTAAPTPTPAPAAATAAPAAPAAPNTPSTPPLGGPAIVSKDGTTLIRPGDQVITRSGNPGVVRSVNPTDNSARVSVVGNKFGHAKHKGSSLTKVSGASAAPTPTPAATPAPTVGTGRFPSRTPNAPAAPAAPTAPAAPSLPDGLAVGDTRVFVTRSGPVRGTVQGAAIDGSITIEREHGGLSNIPADKLVPDTTPPDIARGGALVDPKAKPVTPVDGQSVYTAGDSLPGTFRGYTPGGDVTVEHIDGTFADHLVSEVFTEPDPSNRVGILAPITEKTAPSTRTQDPLPGNGYAHQDIGTVNVGDVVHKGGKDYFVVHRTDENGKVTLGLHETTATRRELAVAQRDQTSQTTLEGIFGAHDVAFQTQPVNEHVPDGATVRPRNSKLAYGTDRVTDPTSGQTYTFPHQLTPAGDLQAGDAVLINGQEHRGPLIVTKVGPDTVHSTQTTAIYGKWNGEGTESQVFLAQPGRESRVLTTPDRPTLPPAARPQTSGDAIARNHEDVDEFLKNLDPNTTLGQFVNGHSHSINHPATGTSSGDNVLGHIYEHQGFEGLPHVVDDDELDSYVSDQKEVPLYRGISGGYSANDDQVTDFYEGDYFPGFGVFCNGTYAAAHSPRVAQSYGPLPNSKQNGTAIFRMTLKSDAKGISYTELSRLQRKWGSSSDARKQRLARQDGWVAAAAGYDYIYVDSAHGAGSGRAKGASKLKENQYIVVLNRTAIRTTPTPFRTQGELNNYNHPSV